MTSATLSSSATSATTVRAPAIEDAKAGVMTGEATTAAALVTATAATPREWNVGLTFMATSGSERGTANCSQHLNADMMKT